jgi:hypothetical protein
MFIFILKCALTEQQKKNSTEIATKRKSTTNKRGMEHGRSMSAHAMLVKKGFVLIWSAALRGNGSI